MKRSSLITLSILFIFTFIFSSCESNSNEQPTPIPDVPTMIGTLNGEFKFVMNINEDGDPYVGVGLVLDNGQQITAYLPGEIEKEIGKLAPNTRVKVKEIKTEIFDWTVVEGPENIAPLEIPCELKGIIVERDVHIMPGSLDVIGELLSEELECNVSVEKIKEDMFPEVILAGEEADFIVGPFENFSLIDDLFTPILIAESEKVSSSLRGAFIAKSNSEFETFAEFEGATFMYENKQSIFGYILPRIMLNEAGYDVNAFFSDTVAGGNNPIILIDHVIDGDVDLGIVLADEKRSMLDMLGQENPDFLDAVKIIAYTPSYPTHGVMVLPTLEEELRNKLSDAFINLSNHMQLEGFFSKSLKIDHLEKTGADFQAIQEMLQTGAQLDEKIGAWD